MVNIKHVVFSFILPITMLVVIPFFILWLGEARTLFTLLNQNFAVLIIGFIILGAGLVLWIDCVVLFYKIGIGTLFPSKTIETKELVIVGPYKYVRNPMIIGVIITNMGEALVFSSWWMLVLAACFFVINTIYMPLSEEKGLVKRFGADYLRYKANVRGWIPKLEPYFRREELK